MMKISRLEKDQKKRENNIIKDVRNIFRSVNKINDTVIKEIPNLLRLKKENKAIKKTIVRDIKNHFEHEEEKNYYKPVTVCYFRSNNYIQYESNSNRNKTLSVEEYFNKIRPHLKDIIDNLKKC